MTEKEVKVFSTPTCGWCVKLKEYLDSKGVKFTSVDVSTDAKGREEMIEKTGQMGVPVTLVGEEVVVGFDKDKLDNLLG